MAAEPRDADPFLVAIRDASGVPAGLGVLVGPREVVTCAHVVAAALDLPADLPERPDAEVTVRWPRLDGTAPVTADVVGWLSLADGDLAVLMLKDDAPEGADPARFAVARPGGTPSVATGQADRLRVFGYPETRPLGQWTEVRIVGQVDGGLLQLNTLDATLPDVRSGYSGSPVCDPATGTVIAVVAQAPPGGSARDSLAITASRVTEFRHTLAPGGHRTVGAARRRGTRPERRYAPAAELTVLHLSDLQFGRAHRDVSGLTEADRAQDRLFARLHTDLAKLAGGRGLWPDLVVVTGDLAEGGLSSEFQQAQQFLEQLREAVDLPRHRLAIVPGNHDINRSASKAYFSDAQADEHEPQAPYWPKWRHYATAFEQVYGEDSSSASPEFTPERPWSLFEMRDLRVVVAGLNSTMAESHRDGDHYGWVGEAQLSWFARELRRYRDDGWLVLGAVHHNAVRKTTDDEENLRDAADLDRILGHRVPGYPDGGPGPLHLLLHGHTHDGQLNRLPSGLPALSTGSAAVVASARPAEVPDQYQFLTLRHDGFTRYTRAYLPDRKTWTGDNRADLRDDLWWHTEPQPLPAPAALAGSPTTADSPTPAGTLSSPPIDLREKADASLSRADVRSEDPFLGRIAEIIQVNHDRAQMRLYPSPVPGGSYLVVTRRDPSGPVERCPVGAVSGDVDSATLEVFVAQVHLPNRSLDRHLRSELVYGGRPPTEQVRSRARAAGVVLRSLADYNRVLDLDRLQSRQLDRLVSDSRYPNALYVPQRFRQVYPPTEEAPDAGDGVEEDVLARVAHWMGEDGARFVMVLGDFGRGKTFLMRQLVRKLPKLVNGPEPLLIELRSLEKGPDLFDLVGQHLRRLDVGDVTDAKVRHAVTRGGVVVLLDGFDELVQRVTYPTAAAYLDTLLEAATDEAKVVVTSRTQHFRDDSQIRQTLLGTRTGRQSTRIVALEDFSDPQIRTFLSHLYGGDEVRAGRRVDRLDEIKDLLGLSRNPRMLAFLAELPDNDLDEARSSGGRIRAADLYAKILDHWLRGEVSRQKVRFGPEPLSREHRWAACRELALRLWATPNTTGDTVGVADLSETVVAALTELESLGFSSDQVTHAIGSGSLLTRTLEGFGFVHRSVMEWLVADTLATAVRAGRRPLELASSPMSDLMTDFFCDLAGPPVAGSWADEVLRGKDGGPSRQQESANATRVRARLRRRAALDLAESGEPAASAPETVVPLDLSGQDLRDQDLAAFSGPSTRGEPGGLRHAVLRDTIWAGKGVTGLDLAGADLTRADLEGTRLLDVDLTHATLSGARLAGAHLTRVDLRGADLRGADLNRAVLKDVDLRGADLDGSLWHRTAVLGGTQDAGPDWSFADRTTAVSGRDPAVPVLAVSGSVAAVAHLPQENLLAVARGNGVELVSLSTRTTLRVLTGHTSEVWAVGSVGLPGGRTLLASGSADGTVRWWDPVTGTAVGEPLTGHTDRVLAVASVGLPDGRTLLASGSTDRTVRLWDPVTGTAVGDPLTGHTDTVLAVASVGLPGGRTLLASGSWDGTVRWWDPVTGTAVGDPLTGHTSGVRAVASVGLPGGRTLLASGNADGTVRLHQLFWELSTDAVQPLRADPPIPTARPGLRTTVRSLLRPRSPAAVPLQIPEVTVKSLATLAAAADGAWALLLADGCSYKAEGDVSDVLWWTIKTVRFEAGELDGYDPTIRRLPLDEAVL